jgi:uncharacterized membrane protein YozB (DUF420 family)
LYNDIVRSITLTLSVVAMFLLVLGLPLVKGINNKKNLKRHGILTAVALVLQTTLIFVVMVPSFVGNFDAIVALPPLFFFNHLLHIALGLSAFISGYTYVALWILFVSSQMRCARAKKYMMPTFIVWIIAVISGALIYMLQMF